MFVLFTILFLGAPIKTKGFPECRFFFGWINLQIRCFFGASGWLYMVNDRPDDPADRRGTNLADPLLRSVWRMTGQSISFHLISLKNRLLEIVRKAGVPAAIGAMGLVFAFAGGIFAIQSTAVANAVFLFATAPFFAAILGWIILREPVRKATKIAFGVAGLGMVIMLWEGLAAGGLPQTPRLCYRR